MGKFLNEYEELKLLGKGSFAKIYKVRHLELDYIRAIRVLNETVSDNDNDNKVYQSFINECKTLLKLGNGGHPNIVRIYQPRKLQNHALVEMDYIDGCDLEDYLLEKRKFVPFDEVMRFVWEISSALAYCHVDCYEYLYDKSKEYEYKLESELKGQKFKIETDPNDGKKDLISPLQYKELIREYGITHNDLHSKNIMRKRYDGSYILLDFGLAIQDGKAIKSSSRRDGAVEYKAPEKWNRDGIISERSDIYSFGIIMYEMLAGQVPFPFQRDKYSNEEEALFKLSLAHTDENTPPPAIEPLRCAAFEAVHDGKTYEKDYPDWLEQVILKCLAKKPEDRYANGKELFMEIEKSSRSPQTTNNDDLIKLKNENKSLNLRVGTLENEKNEFDSQISSLAKQLVRATSDAEKSKEENSGLKEEIQSLRRERNDFQSKSEHLSKQTSTLSEKNEEVVNLAIDLQAKLEEKEKNNLTLSAELEDAKKERNDFQSKSENLLKQVSTLSEKNEEVINLANDLKTKLEEEEKSNKASFVKLEDLRKERDDFQEENINLSKQISTLSGENEKVIRRVNSLQIQLIEEEKSNKALFVELDNLKKERDDFQHKSVNLSVELKDTKKERDNFQHKNANLSKEVIILSEKTKEAVNLANDLQVKLEEEEKSNRTSFVELEDLRKERDDFQEENINLSKQISTLSGQNEEVIRRVNSLQIQLIEKEKSNKAFFVELEDLRKERDDFQDKNIDLSKQVATISGQNKERINLVNDLRTKLEEKEKSNLTLSVKLKDTEKERADLKSKNEKLLKQIKEDPGKSSTKRWKVTTGIAALLAIFLSVAYIYKPTNPIVPVDNSNYETTISQQKATIDNLQSEKSQLQTHLDDANSEIDQLKNQVSTSGQSNTATFTEKQQEIDRLKKDNNTLKSSVSEKDRTISKQKEELQTAQKTIDRLLRN